MMRSQGMMQHRPARSRHSRRVPRYRPPRVGNSDARAHAQARKLRPARAGRWTVSPSDGEAGKTLVSISTSASFSLLCGVIKRIVK
jgi:hypothetical protein